jgi:hypothetical protein
MAWAMLRAMEPDARQHSPACERNRGPILEVLRDALPERGVVLEIASGTGMHGVYFAPRLPSITWQPSDADERALASIEAWRRHEPSPNLLAALRLDVLAPEWPIEHADAVFNANMIHISPWECCLALFAGAARVLASSAPLVLYGPFQIGGAHTAESNAAFDASLRARDPRWGVRALEDVVRVAEDAGFERERVVAMPANNQTVLFRKR